METSIFNINNLYSAYKKSMKRKANQNSAMAFSYTVEKELLSILESLQNRSYKHSAFKCFVVTKPVVREVFCSQFKDRVVQHLLIAEIEPLFEPTFIATNYACRKHKGTHLAVKHVQQGIQALEDKYKQEAYYIQLDISGFFMSINKKKLFEIIKASLCKKYIKHHKTDAWLNEVLWLTNELLTVNPINNHIKTGNIALFKQVPVHKSLFNKANNTQGLPIGNLSSQFFANVYLNELDQYVKRTLKCEYYYRYVDDMVILHHSPHYLLRIKHQINNYLTTHLQLQLNKNKTKLQTCQKGINFLGYVIRKKYILVRKRVVSNLKQKLYHYFLIKQPSLQQLTSINNTVNSYFGHFKLANSYRLKQSIIKTMIS